MRWHAKNFHEQFIALEPVGLLDEAQRDAKLAKLDAVATPRGISAQDVRAGYRSSRAVRYAEEHSRSEPLLFWQLCSGYAHGRRWAYLGRAASIRV